MYTQSILILSVIVCLLSNGIVGIWPFQAAAYADAQPHRRNAKDVAIIGAGAAGASAAYHLHKLAKSTGIALNITVFEKSPYIGGRSTTVNALGNPLEPVELGASIFVEVNKILKDAVDEFALQPKIYGFEGDEPEILGIWNGEKFVFTQKEGGWAWWDITKLIWKYGLAPVRTQRLMRTTVAKFLKLYEPPFFPFRSLSDKALDLDLITVTAVTGEEFLSANSIGPPFTTDIIQASTRVNYGQNLGIIHGLETMVCMAIEGAMQIEGGNWQIFDNMIKAANANVLLDTVVTKLENENSRYVLYSSTSSNSAESATINNYTFDTIILAAPFQFSGIELAKDLVKRVPDEIPYVKLHVTLFTSPLKLSRTHFNLREGDQVPTTILTTLSPEEDPRNRHNIVGKTGFFSISTLKTITHPVTSRKEYIYKIFSPQELTGELLRSLFDIKVTPDTSVLEPSVNGSITWYYPHVWHAYPYEYPRVTFEDLELARGFYYTAGIESFISTMETSALMGKNVAQLVIDDYVEVLGKMKQDDSKNAAGHQADIEEL